MSISPPSSRLRLRGTPRFGAPAPVGARLAPVWLALMLAACGSPAHVATSEPPPDLVLRDVALDHHSGGRPAARATVAELRYRREARLVSARDLRLEPLDHAGRPDALLVTGAALADLRAGTVRLSDGVEYASPAGDRLRTSNALADLVSDTATGEQPVTVEGPGYRMEGDSFAARWGADPAVHLRGRVRASVAAPGTPARKAPARHARPGGRR